MANIFRRSMIAGVTVLAIAGFASPAEAAVSDCGSNRVCLWGENDYSGCFKQIALEPYVGYQLPGRNWATCSSTMNNGANSVRNELRSVDGEYMSVRFYDDDDLVGAYLRFDSQESGENFTDPYLGNGGGVAGNGPANAQWNNRISGLVAIPR